MQYGTFTLYLFLNFADVLVSATIAVMAVVNGQLETLDQYKIYTRSISRIIELPQSFLKDFNLAQRFDSMAFLMFAKIQELMNTAEKASSRSSRKLAMI